MPIFPYIPVGPFFILHDPIGQNDYLGSFDSHRTWLVLAIFFYQYIFRAENINCDILHKYVDQNDNLGSFEDFRT